MVLEGQFEVPASKEMVWGALNDVAILEKCIVGCESMERLSDSQFRGVIRFKLGPIRALFNTAIELRDVVPLEAYTLVVKGKGGAAGMGEGILNVMLDEQNELTTLEYAVEMNRLIELQMDGSVG